MPAVDTKRPRTESSRNGANVKHSRLYQPFRAIGYITTDVPFLVETRGQDFFLTTSVGNSFQTYNVRRIRFYQRIRVNL